MTDLVNSRGGIKKTQKIYHRFYEYFLFNYKYFDDSLAKAILLLCDYLRSSLNMHLSYECLDNVNKLIQIVKEKFSDNPSYSKILVELNWIKIFAFNQQDKIDEALIISQEAIDESSLMKNKVSLIKTWMTKGDVYYSYSASYQYKQQIISCWDNAIKLYETETIYFENDFEKEACKLNLFIREILITIFQENFYDLKVKMHKILQYLNNTKMSYFEIKLRLLYVMSAIFQNTQLFFEKNEYDLLETLVKESIDLCALYGNDTLYLDCFHTLAILQRYSGKHDLAMDSYKKTYIVFEHIFENNKLDHWTYLLFDMAISIKSGRADKKLDYTTPDIL